jgi:hypothetical protein
VDMILVALIFPASQERGNKCIIPEHMVWSSSRFETRIVLEGCLQVLEVGEFSTCVDWTSMGFCDC